MAATQDNEDPGYKRLFELETEYRAQRVSDRLHAIASFSYLFDDFPNPTIINSGFLKLADYFQSSTNTQRHAILQVFIRAERHMKKIMNVEEVVKRISPQLQSNDPLARALTLRAFGTMAVIVSDRVDVYHRVIHSLDSLEAMEVSAAIFAADRICSHSQRFCAIISGKLAFMVRDEKTPLPVRRRLIRIFGHMFEDITLARLARKTCLDILELTQDTEYIVAILRTLTRLASHSLVDVPEQIELLLQQAEDQSVLSTGIRRVSLMCLGSLAQRGIEFNPTQIKAIFTIALDFQDEKTTLRAVSTLHKVFLQAGVMTSLLMLPDAGQQTIAGYIEMALHIIDRSATSASLSHFGMRLLLLETYALLSVLLPSYKHGGVVEWSEAAEHTYHDALRETIRSMEGFLVRLWTPLKDGTRPLSQEESGQSGTVLRYWLMLTLEEESGAEKMFKSILGWMEDYKDLSLILSKALLHVAQVQPKLVHGLQDVILTLLENRVDSSDTRTFTVLYRTLLESLSLNRRSFAGGVEALEARISTLVERFGQMDMEEQPTRNHWELYQLGRYSLQTGWPSLATMAFKNLERGLRSVPHALWLLTVQTLALTESSLQTISSAPVVRPRRGSGDMEISDSEGVVDLYSHQQMYVKIIGYLEEIEANQAMSRSFQLKLCSLRREYLQTCQQAVTTLHLLTSSVVSHRLKSSNSAFPSSLAFVPLPSDERGLYQCADQWNQLAHQYTLLRAWIAVQETTANQTSSSSASNYNSSSSVANGGAENTTSFSIVTGESSHSVPKFSSDQQSDAAVEILQTMCLVLAYSFQKLAKVLGRTAVNGDGQQPDEDEDEEIFDIDPLLIPLLYHQDREELDANSSSSSAFVAGGPRTLAEVFRASTRKALGYVDRHLQGGGVDTLEMSLSLVQQLIVQFISFPVSVPQMFFVSRNAALSAQP
ncbi:Integrator complex subunit 7 [Linnemannia gamsii]|uniref:Integrator complex subunit 7 n=1 Tax=Linnemannia gamsii TaxID=64522 RepID=A0A9P6REB2_9FUNG|nr:Integrator complex subunit 7 [Linnemannia gamsii]